jgi:hypothetical protein
VGAWHARQLALFPALTGLPTPHQSADVVSLMAVLLTRHQRQHHSRLPITIAEFAGIYARGFDLRYAAGHHRRLALLLTNLGCLRRGAATHLTITYTIRAGRLVFDSHSTVRICYSASLATEYISIRITLDKNVESSQEVYAYIPAVVPTLGVHPVALLRDYILTFQPPSGGYLLSAPATRGVGPARFNTGPYTNLATAYKAAYLTAFPGSREVDIARVASHSGRKSLASWLWDRYRSTRLIADVGHWQSPKAFAVALYFRSTREHILRCLQDL